MITPRIVHKEVCTSCGKYKTVGEFDFGYAVPQLCCQCLDNASRIISKQTDRITWDRQESKLRNIYQEDIKAWEKLYPDVDVMRVIEKRIPEWIIKNVLVGKAVKSDYRRFIVNWLKKEQIKAVGL